MIWIKTKPEVRILDTPLQMIIQPNFILVPLPDGKVMILHGKFKNIRDKDAYILARKTLDKVA